jgi:hypothetical protein
VQRDYYLDRAAALFCGDTSLTIANVLLPQPDSITPAQTGIRQHVKPDPFLGPDRPSFLIGGHIDIGPNRKSLTRFQGGVFDLGCRIDFDKPNLLGPRIKASHGINEGSGLVWCLTSFISTGRDMGICNGAVGLSTGRLDYLVKDVLPLFASCR